MTDPKEFDLRGVRADGWFQRLEDDSSTFKQLCDMVGDAFVAFAMVAGLEIRSVMVNPNGLDSSIIEFAAGMTERPQRLLLGDFRQKLAEALARATDHTGVLPPKPSPNDLQAHIGFRYLLLAPIFGIQLESLCIDGDREMIRTTRNSQQECIDLDAFRQTIRQLILEEASRAAALAKPVSLDSETVEEARGAAEQGQPQEVVRLLEQVIAPLALVPRSFHATPFSDEDRATIAHVAELLSNAYSALNRSKDSIDVLRLGLQWNPDTHRTLTLYAALGEAHLRQGSAGQAVGAFRRALSMDDAFTNGWEGLARAFGKLGQHVASRVCAYRAGSLHADSLSTLQSKSAVEASGKAWARWQALVTPNEGRPVDDAN